MLVIVFIVSGSTSLPSSDKNADENAGGDDPQDDSPQDDSTGTGGSSDGNGDDDDGGNNDNDGIGQTDDQNLVGDDDRADEEPPTSTERGGNPLEGLNVGKAGDKVACEKYLKSLGGGDETNVGDIIVDPFETREEHCKRILGAGIDISNNTMTTTSELMNQTGLINNNNATEGEMIIKEEGTSSGPSRPQPQPSPSPKPC